jgi:hypothetical protein
MDLMWALQVEAEKIGRLRVLLKRARTQGQRSVVRNRLDRSRKMWHEYARQLELV